MSVLFISHVKIKDQQLFSQYLDKTQKIASQFGAEMITRGKFNHSMRGDLPDHNLVVIVRFPDTEVVHAWLNSDAYQEIISLREQASEQYMTVYEELS